MAEHEKFSEDAIYLTVRTYDDGTSVIMDAATDSLYVKKTLSDYNAASYDYLKTHEDIQIPEVYSVKEEDGKLTVIEEFIHGKKLDDLLKSENKLSFLDRKRILFAVCEGLNFLHSADPKIVHGDLKASDILIMDDGTVKLTGYNTALTDANADIAALGALIRQVLPESGDALKIADMAETPADEASDKAALTVADIKEALGKLSDPNDRGHVPGFGSRSIGVRIVSWAVLAAAVAAAIYGIFRYQKAGEEEVTVQEAEAVSQRELAGLQEDQSGIPEASSLSSAAAADASSGSPEDASGTAEASSASSEASSVAAEASSVSSKETSGAEEAAAVSGSSEGSSEASETLSGSSKETSETTETSSGSAKETSDAEEVSAASSEESSEATDTSSVSSSESSVTAEITSGSSSESSVTAETSSVSSSESSEIKEVSSGSSSESSVTAETSSGSSSESSVTAETSSGSSSESSEVTEASSGSTKETSDAEEISAASSEESSGLKGVSSVSSSESSAVTATSSGSTKETSDTDEVSARSTEESSASTETSSVSSEESSEIKETSSGSAGETSETQTGSRSEEETEEEKAAREAKEAFAETMCSAAADISREKDADKVIEGLKTYMAEADEYAEQYGTETAEAYRKELVAAGINSAVRQENAYRVSGSHHNASEALKIYEALGNYTEYADISSKAFLDSIAGDAAKAMENGKLNKAERIYTLLSKLSYDGAENGLKNAAYQKALRLLEAGSFLEAADMFDEISGYKDADEQAVMCRSHYTSSIKAAANAESGVAVSWVTLEEADGYFLTMDDTVTYDLGPDSISYTFTEANTNGKEYSFTVTPYFIDKEGNKDKGAESPAYTWTFLKKTLMQKLSSDKAGEVTITWEPNEYAGYYEVAYGLTPELTSAVVIMYMADQPTTQKIDGLIPGTYYYFKVRSSVLGLENKVYSGAWSETVPIIARDYAVEWY